MKHLLNVFTLLAAVAASSLHAVTPVFFGAELEGDHYKIAAFPGLCGEAKITVKPEFFETNPKVAAIYLYGSRYEKGSEFDQPNKVVKAARTGEQWVKRENAAGFEFNFKFDDAVSFGANTYYYLYVFTLRKDSQGNYSVIGKINPDNAINLEVVHRNSPCKLWITADYPPFNFFKDYKQTAQDFAIAAAIAAVAGGIILKATHGTYWDKPIEVQLKQLETEHERLKKEYKFFHEKQNKTAKEEKQLQDIDKRLEAITQEYLRLSDKQIREAHEERAEEQYDYLKQLPTRQQRGSTPWFGRQPRSNPVEL